MIASEVGICTCPIVEVDDTDELRGGGCGVIGSIRH